MAIGGIFLITPHTDGRCYGRDALAQIPLPPQAGGSMWMGTNIANPTCLNGSWPFADIVKMSTGWSVNGGTGNYTIDNQGRITSIDGTIELSKILSYGNLNGLPRAGTYTVTKPAGSCDIQILAGATNTGFQSADTFTFTCNAGDPITLYARSTSGTAQDLLAVSVVHQDDLATYQSGTPWSQLWYSFMQSMNPQILRMQLTHDLLGETWADRTLPEALSYAADLDRRTGLSSDRGSLKLQLPLELQIDLANRLSPEVLWWQIPAWADNNYISNGAALFRDTLNTSVSIALERGNEFWNTSGIFYYNSLVGRVWFRNRIRCVGGSGTNTWTTQDSSPHGFNNGDVIYTIVSPGSSLTEEGSAYGGNFDQTSRPSVPYTPMQVANATTTSFDVVSLVDGTTPYTAQDGVDEIFAWAETADDLLLNFDSLVHLGEEVGRRASEFFNIATPILSPTHTVYRGLGTQSDVTALTDAMAGVNGANGNYDVIYIGNYFNAVDSFVLGDTNQNIYDDHVIAYQSTNQQTIVAHINAGYTAENIWFYESGFHSVGNLVADNGSNGTVNDRDTAYIAFKQTQLNADLEDAFYRECRDLGVRYACITSMDTYVFGSAGTWGSKQEVTDPDLPITDLYQSWNGYIAPTPVTVTSYYHYLQHHSLWQHTLVSDPANNFTVWTDYWIGELAKAASLDYRSNGKFNQLQDTGLLPLSADTGAANTPDSWPSGSFESQVLDSVTIMPPNFTWQTDTVATHVGWASTLLNYIETARPNETITVYEHWHEFGASPPFTEQQMIDYWNIVKGGYHTFYVDYFNGLVAAHPTLNFKFIPAGVVIADMLTGVAESGIDITALQAINQNNSLFLDDSPHGAPSMYFLVAMVCYRVFFNQNPPLSYVPPSANIDSVIVNNYSTVVDYIDARVQHYNTQLSGAVL